MSHGQKVKEKQNRIECRSKIDQEAGSFGSPLQIADFKKRNFFLNFNQLIFTSYHFLKHSLKKENIEKSKVRKLKL